MAGGQPVLGRSCRAGRGGGGRVLRRGVRVGIRGHRRRTPPPRQLPGQWSRRGGDRPAGAGPAGGLDGVPGQRTTIDATAAAITGNGGALLAAPFHGAGNSRVTMAVDPTGAVFGVWQAGRGGIGAEVVAEPGAMVWTDAHLPDPDRGRAFYTGVFGYEYQPVPGAPRDYTTFSLGADRLGGMGGMMGAPAGTRPWWLAYFAVADTAAAVAAARTAGGTLLSGPDDTPFGFGRMALLTDPDGATFAVVASAGTG